MAKPVKAGDAKLKGLRAQAYGSQLPGYSSLLAGWIMISGSWFQKKTGCFFRLQVCMKAGSRRPKRAVSTKGVIVGEMDRIYAD